MTYTAVTINFNNGKFNSRVMPVKTVIQLANFKPSFQNMTSLNTTSLGITFSGVNEQISSNLHKTKISA